jgi:hypothetical protein
MDLHRAMANSVTDTPAFPPASGTAARASAIECVACAAAAAAVGGVGGWYFVAVSLMRPATGITRVGLALLAGDGVRWPW